MEIIEEEVKVDEGLYSRQLYVMGLEAQRKMAASDVLLVGLSGLGVELAKNVVLAGVKSMTLLDDGLVSSTDLASNFYCCEEDIGRPRAAVCAPRLAELNPYVPVRVVSGGLSISLVTGFRVVVLIDVSMELQRKIGDFCHANSICVIMSDLYGVFGNIFCDFGPSFTVSDVDGEPAASCLIASITRDSPALVHALEESRHHLSTGDIVEITGVTGMDDLNGRQFAVTVKDPNSFAIDVDTTNMTPYGVGGYVKQIKQPAILSFQKYSESLENPGEFVCDLTKCDRPGPLHFAFRALKEYPSKSKSGLSLPRPGNMEDAEDFYQIAVALNEKASSKGLFHVEDLSSHKTLIHRLSLCARGMISPMCALMGGIIGQEVLKAASGKFTPIKQWMYYDALEALSDEILPESEVTPGPVSSRYDGQIMVFGKSMQRSLSEQSLFLVGAGAIGCEMLKNWAMMGLACEYPGSDRSGLIHVTDMDHIEKSNLSRQFLFRNTDINRPKSRTAAKAAASMNPGLKYLVYETKVSPETENLFNDDFYESLTLVCTALDNVEARLYVDQKCVFYQLPLMESGTLGTKGHTQIVVPKLTENYGATRDPPEKSIPLCTLKHFPNLIEHTIQWAREWFEESFHQSAEDCNKCLQAESKESYFSSLSSQQNMMLETMNRVKDSLKSSRPSSFSDCIIWARICFEDLFSHKIMQLLHNYPLDRVADNGTPFWSGAKKPPAPLIFDETDPLHFEFISYTALMRSRMYGVQVSSEQCDPDHICRVLRSFQVPAFRPSETVKYAIIEEELKKSSGDAPDPAPADDTKDSTNSFEVDCRNLLSELDDVIGVGRRGTERIQLLQVIDFDKDLDDHMHVIGSCANLRARNYRIPEADFHTARGIAGKITPAISTTTAFVAGAICLEVYKIIQKKKLEQFLNTFSNLAIPLFTSMAPEPPKVVKSIVKSKEWNWTMWDYIDVRDPAMTLSGLISFLDTEYGLTLSMLSSGVTILYSDFMNRKKLEERKHMPIKAILESVVKKELPSSQRFAIFEVIATDNETGDEVELPYLRFRVQ